MQTVTDQAIAEALRLPQLRKGARKLSGYCDDRADDLLQETFLKASRYKHNFRQECSLTSWLYEVMFSCSRRVKHRGMDRVTHYVEPWLVGEQIAGTNVEKQVEVLQVISLMDRRLSDPIHRAVFEQVLLGEEHDEIARTVGIGPKTVRTRAFRIREMLSAEAA